MYYIEREDIITYYSKEFIDRNLWLDLLQLRQFNIFFQIKFTHVCNIYMNFTFFFLNFNNLFFTNFKIIILLAYI